MWWCRGSVGIRGSPNRSDLSRAARGYSAGLEVGWRGGWERCEGVSVGPDGQPRLVWLRVRALTMCDKSPRLEGGEVRKHLIPRCHWRATTVLFASR